MGHHTVKVKGKLSVNLLKKPPAIFCVYNGGNLYKVNSQYVVQRYKLKLLLLKKARISMRTTCVWFSVKEIHEKNEIGKKNWQFQFFFHITQWILNIHLFNRHRCFKWVNSSCKVRGCYLYQNSPNWFTGISIASQRENICWSDLWSYR